MKIKGKEKNYVKFLKGGRDRAKVLAEEIDKDLFEFTVHDIGALREIAHSCWWSIDDAKKRGKSE